MSRNVLIAILGMVLFVVVAGAMYLEIAVSAGATDQVWEVTRPVNSGDTLNQDSVRRTRVPHSGDNLDYFTANLTGSSRAAHDMSAGTLLFRNDVLQSDLALVNLTLKTPPQLAHGQTIDVYLQVGSQTMLVGRRLVVDQITGTNAAVWVPAADEPAWVTVQAGNGALFAARSTGVGVPQTRGQRMDDAIATLTGGSAVGPGAGPATSPSPSPTPTPKKP
ncbi:MAG TPA: hypothetical protein VGO86_00060 [Candidatus Dormibacteraeota bacterium]